MYDATLRREYSESTIEEEPILGRVLALPNGRVQPLSWTDRLLLAVGLTDARRLEAKYLPARTAS